jgi:hypothetical protein
MIEDYIFDTEPPSDSYIEYLYLQKSDFSQRPVTTFILKLLSCPICFSAWLALIASIFAGNLLYLGVLFFPTLGLAAAFNFILKKLH